MTDLIFREVEDAKLSIQFHDLIYSDRAFKRSGNNNWMLSWKNGELFEINSGEEIPVFHFVDLKNSNARNEIIDPVLA